MNATAIDNRLTEQLQRFNGGLHLENTEGFLQAKLALGVALGILTAIAPEDAYMVNALQEGLLTAATADELYPVKETIFSSAFARLNALAG